MCGRLSESGSRFSVPLEDRAAVSAAQLIQLLALVIGVTQPTLEFEAT